MSKIIDIKGKTTQTEFKVDNLGGKHIITEKQFIQNQQDPTYVYGAPNMSANSLYCIQTSVNHVAELWHRSSIYSDFTYLQSFPTTDARPFGKLSSDGSVIALAFGSFLNIYERDPITDIYTLTYTDITPSWHMDLSTDGNTVILENNPVSVKVYKRDSPASWTQLTRLNPVDGLTPTIWGATYAYCELSDNGEYIASLSTKGVSFWTRNVDGITYTETPQVTYDGSGIDICYSVSLNSDASLLLVSTDSRTELWKRLPSWTRIHLFDVYDDRSQMSMDGTTVRIGDFIYKGDSTFTKWDLIFTLPAPITITNDKPAFSFDYYGYTFMTSGISESGSKVYSIKNDVLIEQSINTKFLNFNDTLKITSAFGSADYTLMFPSEQGGVNDILTNDGSGALGWSTPVAGPSSNSLYSFAQYDGTTGKLLKDSVLNSLDANTLSFGTNTLFKKQGQFNQAFGCNPNNLGNYNIIANVLGGGAVAYPIDSIYNTCIGYRAGNNEGATPLGDRNMFIGGAAGAFSEGSRNVGIGTNALLKGTGDNNIGFGSDVALELTTATDSVFIGGSSGSTARSNVGVICIGKSSNVSGTATVNEISIGDDCTGNGSNSVTLGNASLTSLVTNGTTCDLGTKNKPFNSIALKLTATVDLMDVTLSEGVIQYDSTQKKLVYSNGIQWRTIG